MIGGRSFTITIVAGLLKLGTKQAIDYYIMSAFFFILFVVGLIVIRKLIAIRVAEINLSLEMSLKRQYFIEKYPQIDPFVGKYFKILTKDSITFCKYQSSDFQSILFYALLNCLVLAAGIYCLVFNLNSIAAAIIFELVGLVIYFFAINYFIEQLRKADKGLELQR